MNSYAFDIEKIARFVREKTNCNDFHDSQWEIESINESFAFFLNKIH